MFEEGNPRFTLSTRIVGLIYDKRLGMITRSRDTIVDMNETYLRIQLDSTHPNCYWRIIRRPEDHFQQLNNCFLFLKNSLVRVPDHINDKTKFAQTVDLVESNTKMFINAIDDVISRSLGLEDEVSVRRRIRNFVSYITNFWEESSSYRRSSRTRGATKQDVITSAAHLAYHANRIMNSVIDKCEIGR